MPENLPAGESAAAPHAGFLFNVNLVFGGTLAVNAASFLIVVIIARALGPDGRGVTSLYQAAINVGYAVLSLGVSVAAIYFVSREEVSPREAVESGLTVTLVATGVCALGVAMVTPLAGGRLLDAHVPYWMAIAAVPLSIQFRVLEGVLRARGRFVAMSLLELSLPLTNLIALGAVEVSAGLTVWRMIVVWSLAGIVPVAIGYAYLGVDALPRRLLTNASFGRMARFGVQGQLGNLVQLLNYRLDSYLVLVFVNAAGVGLYAIGVSLSEGLWLISNAVAIVLVPKLTAAGADYAAETTPLVCRNMVLITALGAGVAAALSSLFIPLFFGKAFDGAIVPFLWLLPGTVALAGAKILSAYVFSRGRPLINTWIAVATLAVTLVADLALIPAFEVAGAAIASSLAYGVSLALTAVAYRRLSGGSIAEALLPRLSDQSFYADGLRSLARRVRPPAAAGPPGVRSNP